jgi:ankyrin repeat protein
MKDAAGSNKRRKLAEPYSLPLHIALDNGGSKDVIEALIKAGPDVISMTDGPDGCTALSVALYKGCTPETIAMLVKASPKAVQIVDRHHNTALHVGCSKGASIDVMKMLYGMYPKALTQSNFHSQKPLDVAQRTTVCSLSVIDFLQALVLESLERQASHLVNSEDDELV